MNDIDAVCMMISIALHMPINDDDIYRYYDDDDDDNNDVDDDDDIYMHT